MSRSTPAGMAFSYDDNGGTPVDITAHVLTINDIDVEEITEQSNPFGVNFVEHDGVGVVQIPDVELGGFYDDVAVSGPDALFGNRLPEGPGATTRTFQITWRSGKTTAWETRLKNYRRSAARGELTKYTAVLAQASGVTEA